MSLSVCTVLLGFSTIIASSLPATVCAMPMSSTNFRPTAGASWNIQLNSVPDPSSIGSEYHIWDMDLFDTPKANIDALHKAGHPVICYFSGGSWEDWRADKIEFPAEALGKVMDGWPSERWVDTRNAKVRQIMVERIKLAKTKGCDGIDVDNVDGYDNDTGFKLTQKDGIDFVRFLAQQAHALGLSYGLKNAGDIIPKVIDVCEWVVNEQCVEYDECALYQPFIKANKPVFHIEYTSSKSPSKKFMNKACHGPDTKGFSTLVKHMELDGWTKTC